MARTARQRIASRHNLIKARRTRSHDTLGHFLRKGIKMTANKGTFGAAGPANEWISGEYRKKSSKFYKDRSGKRSRKKR